MNKLFVDTLHLVALINPKDQWHQKSVEVETATRNFDLVTTEDILTEVLNFYAESGEFMRMKVAAFVREILLDVRVEVIAGNETTFFEALELYESRLDKGYSLTDCISLERSAGRSPSRKFSRTTIILSRKALQFCCRIFQTKHTLKLHLNFNLQIE